MRGVMARVGELLGVGALGVVIAGGVFAGLTALVAGSGGGAASARVEARKIAFSRLVADTPSAPKQREEKPEPRPAEPPPTYDFFSGSCARCGGAPVPTPIARPAPLERFAGTRDLAAAQGFDTDEAPLVRILPEYPPHARGEGWVLVRFDVSASGAVENARVVDAAPRGVFEGAALRAIARWRYRPAVTQGRAVSRRGLEVRLRFALARA